MLGWMISYYRQEVPSSSPATFKTAQGTELAVWQAGVGGIGWLDSLVKRGDAVLLGGDGYPLRYTAKVLDLLPVLRDIPFENKVWVAGPQDILLSGWKGRTTIDQAKFSQCQPDEWLIVEVWDES